MQRRDRSFPPGRQFCSRFVREVVAQATAIKLGEVETFSTLLQRNLDVSLNFWRCWFLGRIPWQRRTVTPASLLLSPNLRMIFERPEMSFHQDVHKADAPSDEGQ